MRTHTHILTCVWTCILCQLSECRFTCWLGCRCESRPCRAGTRMVQSCEIKETPAPLLSQLESLLSDGWSLKSARPRAEVSLSVQSNHLDMWVMWYVKMKCIVGSGFSQVRYLQRGSWFSQWVSHTPGDAFRYLSVHENQFYQGQDRPAVDSKMQRLTSVVVMGVGFWSWQ